MEYWVYENWVHDKAIVHKASCSYCNEGRGMHPDSSEDHGKWRGPFRTREDALADPKSTGRTDARGCKACGP